MLCSSTSLFVGSSLFSQKSVPGALNRCSELFLFHLNKKLKNSSLYEEGGALSSHSMRPHYCNVFSTMIPAEYHTSVRVRK